MVALEEDRGEALGALGEVRAMGAREEEEEEDLGEDRVAVRATLEALGEVLGLAQVTLAEARGLAMVMATRVVPEALEEALATMVATQEAREAREVSHSNRTGSKASY
jgi:hypothetical protein